MIARILSYIQDRHIRRGFAQLEAGSGVLLLTEAHARAYDRDARSYASRRAHAKAEAYRLKSHRLLMEVSVLRGMA